MKYKYKFENSNNGVKKLIGLILKNGKYSLSYKKLNFLLLELKNYYRLKNFEINLNDLIFDLVTKVKPTMGLRNRKIAGRRYKAPYLMEEKRAFRYSFKWFGEEIKERSKFTKFSKFVKLNTFFSLKDLKESYKGEGFMIKKLQNYNSEVVEHRSSSRYF